jgi:uncharacterized protein (DUF1330 family)
VAAYFIVRALVHDWDAYRAYADRSPGVLARFGGRHIARGGRTITFEGDPIDPAEGRLVIAEFPDFESAEACYRSDDYQSIIPHRANCATLDFYLIDGLEDTMAT